MSTSAAAERVTGRREGANRRSVHSRPGSGHWDGREYLSDCHFPWSAIIYRIFGLCPLP